MKKKRRRRKPEKQKSKRWGEKRENVSFLLFL
jgi:hypothetical protein